MFERIKTNILTNRVAKMVAQTLIDVNIISSPDELRSITEDDFNQRLKNYRLRLASMTPKEIQTYVQQLDASLPEPRKHLAKNFVTSAITETNIQRGAKPANHQSHRHRHCH